MAIKDIVTVVDANDRTDTVLDAAATLALRHDSHLTGLHAAVPVRVPGYIRLQIPDEVQRFQAQAQEDHASNLKSRFEQAMNRHGLEARSNWLDVAGDPLVSATDYSRYADLMVIGQDRDGKQETPDGLPEQLVLASGRPVLVVPYAGRPNAIGDHIMIAWRDTREAARAVSDAMPLLESSTKVTVLALNEDQGRRRTVDSPAGRLAEHLARHGIDATAVSTEPGDVSVADAILNHASDHGVDLLVMGAYGHGRFREMVLGGVTRSMLQHMTVPVLMSH